MAEYVEVEQARGMSGLRLVLTAGVPGPWGEAAKGLFHVKRIPFVRVRQIGGGPNQALEEWTGQTSAPVAVWNDERPRTTSTELLFLAERLAPDPPLLPANAEDRAIMLGLSHEIYGELGLGWCRRLMMFHPMLGNPETPETVREGLTRMGVKYGYDRAAADAAPARVADLLRVLGARLESQRTRGSRFLVGDRLSAVDIYWATFSAMIDPLPHELCPMPGAIRGWYTVSDQTILAAARPYLPLLLEHRDFIYRRFLELPVDF